MVVPQIYKFSLLHCFPLWYVKYEVLNTIGSYWALNVNMDFSLGVHYSYSICGLPAANTEELIDNLETI